MRDLRQARRPRRRPRRPRPPLLFPQTLDHRTAEISRLHSVPARKAGIVNPTTRTLSAAAFLAEAHRNGFHGPEGLRRWAMRKNASRRSPVAYITTEIIETAIALERAQTEEEPNGPH